MITPAQSRVTLPESYKVSDAELERILAYFYFIGDQAYEQVRKEKAPL